MNDQRPIGSQKRRRTVLKVAVVIISIPVLLFALSIWLYPPCSYNTMEARTHAEIRAMQDAIEAYRFDHGRYPDSGNKTLFIALSGNRTGTGRDPDSKNKAYFFSFRDGKGGNIRKDGGRFVIIDPSGNPYNYVSGVSAAHHKDAFDLWSNGPDRRPGTADDVGNWKQ